VTADDETQTTDDQPKAKEKPSGFEAAYYAEKGRREKAELKLNKDVPADEKNEFDWTNPTATIDKIKSDMRLESDVRFAEMSEAQCRGRNKDFQEKYDVFEKMAIANPALIQTIMSNPDPAQKAYDLATDKMFSEEVGADPATYREKIEAEMRIKIEAENKTKNTATEEIAAGLPPSAASMVDKVPNSGPPKDSFDDLFPGEVQS
jgi:hypothetical protein